MRRRRQAELDENGVTTTAGIATFVAAPAKVARGLWPGKRKRRKKRKSKRSKGQFRIPREAAADALFGMLDEALPDVGAELVLDEKVGHTRKGDGSAMKAWFAKFLGKRVGKKGKGASSTFRGKGKYASRKYKLTKLGGGQYSLKRVA